MLMLMTGVGVHGRNIDVLAFGITADGTTLQTQKIQQVIDECASSGGGIVEFPPGRYLTGMLRLRSHVELRLDRGATLMGSTNLQDDYPPVYGQKALIYAEGIEDAGLSGHGVMDGQAASPDYPYPASATSRLGGDKRIPEGGRPYGIFFLNCRNMTAEDVEIRDVGCWTFKVFRCDGVRIRGIKIHAFLQMNNDGMDIEARNVTVSDCIIDCEDDAICLKSDDRDFMTENVAISNCVISSICNPIKFGTSSFAGFRNISITNCIIHTPPVDYNVKSWTNQDVYDSIPIGTLTGLSGIALESADGGIVEHVTISNITMSGIITPIFINLNMRHGGGIGRIRDISISNVKAVANGILPCIISGIPGSRISDITLRDISVEHEGGEKAMAGRLQENLKGYPENRMYGKKNPAGGLYVRHADNVRVYNLRVVQRNHDERPTVVADDVNGLEINGLQTINAGKMPVQGIESTNVMLDGENVR